MSGSEARSLEAESRSRLKRGVALDDAQRSIVRAVEKRPKAPKRFDFLDPVITRELIALSWPITTGMLGETAIGLVNTKLVGGLGPAALGGVGLATIVMYLCFSLMFGGMRAVKVRVSHAIGAGQPQHGYAYARAGVVVGFVFGIFVLFACRDLGWVLRMAGATPEIIEPARDYIAAATLAAPPTCALMALVQHRQGTGDARTPMVVGILGNLFNALFAWSLIYGRFGLPALGVRGAGYSSAITETFEFGIMLALLLREERKDSRAKERPLAIVQAAREIVDLGTSIGAQFTAETLAFTLFTVVLGSIAVEQIAAHQIALNVIRVSFLPGVAIGEAASVIVGRSLGARNLRSAEAANRSALVLAMSFMAACGVAFAISGGAIASVFTSDPSVIAIARRLFYVAAIFQVLDASNIVLRSTLRGAKDVHMVAIIGTLSGWLFIPTSAWLFGKVLGMGALGGWLGFVGETACASAFFWWRWKRGSWRKAYAY